MASLRKRTLETYGGWAESEYQSGPDRIVKSIGGTRHPVASGYVLKSKDKVGFKLANYDRHNPVTIDPSLAYST